jgi:hypothetical protein
MAMRDSIAVIAPAARTGNTIFVHWGQVVYSAELTMALVPGIHGHKRGVQTSFGTTADADARL